jgi:uncharacterized protein (TIGR03435 family)
MRGRLIWTAWLALMAATGAIGAQNGSNGLSTKQQNMAKDVDPDWEVITIKPNNTDNRKDRMDVEGRHVVAMNETVEAMMVTGFNMQRNQVAGLPDWARTEHWDVDGVQNVEGQPDLQQLQSMMRKMLEKRFDLKLHHEQREMPVFALTVAKGGAKLNENLSDPKGHPIRNVRVANGQLANTFTNTSMPDLASMLLFSVDRPIVDRTGLKGRYDFKLQWTMDEVQTTAPDAAPGLFTALQEQIGLKLEPEKAMADVLVVDQVKRPGAN